MTVLTQAHYTILSDKKRSAIKAAQEFPVVYPNIKHWQRKVSTYALVERRIANGLVETGWFEVRGVGWTLTQQALDLFDADEPAPSALSNGHKEAEMTENTSQQPRNYQTVSKSARGFAC